MIAIKTSSWQQWELAPAPDLFEVIEIIIQPFQTWEPGNTIDIWKKKLPFTPYTLTDWET